MNRKQRKEKLKAAQAHTKKSECSSIKTLQLLMDHDQRMSDLAKGQDLNFQNRQRMLAPQKEDALNTVYEKTMRHVWFECAKWLGAGFILLFILMYLSK